MGDTQRDLQSPESGLLIYDYRHVCGICGAPAKFKCSACRGDGFCGQQCFEDAWPLHRLGCGTDLNAAMRAAVSRVSLSFRQRSTPIVSSDTNCWVCFEPGTARRPLFHGGCACRGGAGCGHETCFIESARASRANAQDVTHTLWFRCRTCNQPFIGIVQLALLSTLWFDSSQGSEHLSVILAAAGEHLVALRMAYDRYEKMRNRYGDTHVMLRDALLGVARVLSMIRLPQGIEVHRRLVKWNQDHLSPDHVEALSEVSRLARDLVKHGSLAAASEAVHLLRDNDRRRRTKNDAAGAILLDQALLAEALLISGEAAAALNIVEENEGGARRVLGPSHPLCVELSSLRRRIENALHEREEI